MKKLVIILVLGFFAASIAYSQTQMPPDSKPDEQLTRDEATLRIQFWEGKVKELQDRLKTITDGNTELKKQLDETIAALKKCNEEYYTLIKATKEDVEKFRQQLGILEGKVRQMKNLSNDELAERRAEVEALEKELNSMRLNKIAALPEFYNRIIDLARDIRGLYREKSRPKTYTVGTWAETRDCLWNIAGKIEILGDPFLWPKIWQANTSIIRNPDIIKPGQELVLPQKGPKTPDEIKAERKYWRNKKAAEEQAKPEVKAAAEAAGDKKAPAQDANQPKKGK